MVKVTCWDLVEMVAVGVRDWGRDLRARVWPVKWNLTVIEVREL